MSDRTIWARLSRYCADCSRRDLIDCLTAQRVRSHDSYQKICSVLLRLTSSPGFVVLTAVSVNSAILWTGFTATCFLQGFFVFDSDTYLRNVCKRLPSLEDGTPRTHSQTDRLLTAVAVGDIAHRGDHHTLILSSHRCLRHPSRAVPLGVSTRNFVRP
jgi:hypothetical protein